MRGGIERAHLEAAARAATGGRRDDWWTQAQGPVAVARSMMVCLSSVSGAPGVSTWALLLALALPPGRRRVLLEADPSGGVLAIRYGLPLHRGVPALAGTCRRRPSGPLDPTVVGHRLTDGVTCVPGPVEPRSASALLAEGGADVAPHLVDDEALWLVDCGRSWPLHPGGALVDRAAAHLIVSSGRREALAALPDEVARLAAGAPVGVIVVGRPAITGPDLVALGGDRHWVVRWIDRLDRLAWSAVRSRRARRSGGWRAAVELAAGIDRWLPAPRPVPPLPPPWAYRSAGPAAAAGGGATARRAEA